MEDDEEARKREFFERKAREEREQQYGFAGQGRGPDFERGKTMKMVSFVLAIVSLVLVLVLAAFTYETSSKLALLADSQGNSRSSLASDVTKTQTAVEKMDDAVKGLQQSLAQLAADNKQNAAAIDDMKKRMNRLIDLVK